MEIFFRTTKLRAACSTVRDSDRTWGADRARVVRRRLAELQAAESLAMVSVLPPARLHQLDGQRKGQYAVDAIHPFRLTLEPWHDELPLLEDGGIDKTKVTRVRILAVEDYHGR